MTPCVLYWILPICCLLLYVQYYIDRSLHNFLLVGGRKLRHPAPPCFNHFYYPFFFSATSNKLRRRLSTSRRNHFRSQTDGRLISFHWLSAVGHLVKAKLAVRRVRSHSSVPSSRLATHVPSDQFRPRYLDKWTIKKKKWHTRVSSYTFHRESSRLQCFISATRRGACKYPHFFVDIQQPPHLVQKCVVGGNQNKATSSLASVYCD